jgi:hypothetical protein
MWLPRKEDLDNANHSEDDWEEDNDLDMELENGVQESETPDQGMFGTIEDFPGLIQPTWIAQKQTEMVFATVNTMDTRRNTGIKTK